MVELDWCRPWIAPGVMIMSKLSAHIAHVIHLPSPALTSNSACAESNTTMAVPPGLMESAMRVDSSSNDLEMRIARIADPAVGSCTWPLQVL
jgi:hypothetical protein